MELRPQSAPTAEIEAAEREGPKPVELPHMVTHDLRHFFASALITLRSYAHPWSGEEDRTRTAMDAVLGGLRAGCGQGGTATEVTAGHKV
ncbi:hypothetical protein [Streptomyces sasae]|uniref:hypothetical protein n=1 Tax=Streptomyces sasae TaxID=1266772 RepID=UPI003744777A